MQPPAIGLQLTDNSQSIASVINSLQWTVVTLATISCLCRLYVRGIRKPAFGLDDAAIAIACAMSISAAATCQISTRDGFGTHIWLLTPEQTMTAIKWLMINVYQSYLALFFVRLSIGCFILRMISRDQGRIKYAVYSCLSLNFANTISVIVIHSLRCRPLERTWNPTIPGTCLPGDILTRGNQAFSGISAATDVLFAALPVAVFARLKMNSKRKIRLVVIMLFTLAICVCAIGKAATTDESSSDTTYANGAPAIWAACEINIGIIVASLPVLPQLCAIAKQDVCALRNGDLDLRALLRKRPRDSFPDSDDSDSNLPRALQFQKGPSQDNAEFKTHVISVRRDITVDETNREDSFNGPWTLPYSGSAEHEAKIESV